MFKVDCVVNWVRESSFCKARQKIKHQLFIELYKFIVRFFYAHNGGKRWFHFRLLAVDGSALNLPSSKELLQKFGCHHTNSIGTKIPQARVSFICDIYNRLTLDAQVESFKIGEQEMLKAQLANIGKGNLLTADSNYAHFWLLHLILMQKVAFCMRINKSSNFVKDFLASTVKDAVLVWQPSLKTVENCRKNNVKPEPLKVRLVRIDLPNDETEVLITSLIDQNHYSYTSLKELYEQRWYVEEEFKKFMQRLVVEFFSSIKTNGVLQDFYANIFMLNLVSFLAEPIGQEVYRSSAKYKYRRQTNWTSALSDVRKRLVLLFLREVVEIDIIIESLWKSFKINTEAIKPSRNFPRDKRKKDSRKKAFMQYKHF